MLRAELAEKAGSSGDAGKAFAISTLDELELVHGRRIEDDSEAHRALTIAKRSGDFSVTVAAMVQITQRLEWRGDFRGALNVAGREEDGLLHALADSRRHGAQVVLDG